MNQTTISTLLNKVPSSNCSVIVVEKLILTGVIVGLAIIMVGVMLIANDKDDIGVKTALFGMMLSCGLFLPLFTYAIIFGRNSNFPM